MKMFFQFWHAKTPVFTYPLGWLPWPVEWVLAFPRCPYGAVSINVWSMTCATIISLVGDAVLGMAQEQGEPQGKEKVAVKTGEKKKS